jgi:CheY-like chemotaxis protein
MTRRIVIADDEVHIRRAAEFKLKRTFEVRCAEDGQEAWELLQVERPDVLVTDLQMPHMNGIELIQHVRNHDTLHDLPVILLTAKGFELSQDEVFERLKVFRLVAKPFSPRELSKLVQLAIDDYDESQTACTTSEV